MAGKNRLIYYLKIWSLMSRNAFLIVLAQKKVLLIFLVAKVFRIIFYIIFLFFLVKGSQTIAGYNSTQTIFFFLSFMVVDTTAQFFFREVYRFRPLIVSGDFDLILTKPMNSLFRVLMGGADVIDLITLPPLYLATYYVGGLLNPTLLGTLSYLLLLFNGLLLATALHIAVISLGIITLEIDNTIMIYRDISAMGKFPVDIYKEPLKGFLTFLVPVAVMMTFPAKAFLGLLGFSGIIISFSLAAIFMFISLKFWNYALKQYTSASS